MKGRSPERSSPDKKLGIFSQAPHSPEKVGLRMEFVIDNAYLMKPPLKPTIRESGELPG